VDLVRLTAHTSASVPLPPQRSLGGVRANGPYSNVHNLSDGNVGCSGSNDSRPSNEPCTRAPRRIYGAESIFA